MRAFVLTVVLCGLVNGTPKAWGPGSDQFQDQQLSKHFKQPPIGQLDEQSQVAELPGAPIPITDQKDERLPPSIVQFQTLSEIAISEASTQILPCSATGTPAPSYKWFKDGDPIDPSNNLMYYQDQAGPLTLISLNKNHEGKYQCRAENKYGTTLSPIVVVKLAYIRGYLPGEKVVTPVVLDEGDFMKLSCKPLDGYPLTYTWVGTAGITSTVSNTIVTGQRVTNDTLGNLFFSYVIPVEDELIKPDGSHWIYKCNVKESNTDKTLGGSYTNVTVRRAQPGSGTNSAPQIKYWSAGHEQSPQENQPITALEGENLEFTCYFSGKPTPTINDWDKEKGGLPRDRYTHSSYKNRLTIYRIQATDEGIYRCTGNNREGKAERRFNVIVKAKPAFVPGMSLKDVNGTVGNDVQFDCMTTANPAAHTTWYINGDPLDKRSLPERVEVSADDRSLTVRRVCKTCDGGTRDTDLMVFQCNASNEYGYAFANGYLNVLVATKLTVKPDANVVINYDNQTTTENITLRCVAESDDSTPITYTWRSAGRDLIPPVFTILPDNSLHVNIDDVPNDNKKEYAGVYICEASNGYSKAQAESVLQILIPEHITSGGLSTLLKIIIICLCIILLIVICILGCCIYYYRNRGDEYPVDLIERKRGNDPVKELEANGYHEFQRTMDTGTLKGSRAGLGSRASLSSRRTLDDDEEGLLGDGYYGPGTFNEDGSFIGQYNTASRNRNM